MTRTNVSSAAGRVVMLTCLLALSAGSDLLAQTSTGTIRGRVVDEAGAAVVAAQVVAVNTETGAQRGTLSAQSGIYNLVGLQPGNYELRVSSIGYAAQSQVVRVLIGQTLTIDLQLTAQAVQLEGITVVGTRAVETRTSEVATNVTQEQIENLPQGNRNFLDFAALAPGVQQRQAGISAGGTSASNTNLFIDGATYKSDVLPGGVAGQDPSLARQVSGIGRVLGNPFPQNAVQEFRVITQNYKAEYQKASGAIITAATRSGSNEVHGDFFFSGQDDRLIARNWWQRENEREVPNYQRTQFGGSLGGPIIRDRTHYFASYEGNLQETDTRVEFERRPGLPALPDSLLRGQGLFTVPLRAHLFFGKLTHQLSDRQDLMFTANVRDERDERLRGGYTEQGREVIDNNVNTLLLRHTFAAQPYTNEAQASYQRFRWRQWPVNPGQARFEFQEWGINQGGFVDFQDFVQDRVSLRNDLTWIAGSHVIKGGAYFDFLRYDVTKQLNETPVFRFNPNRPGGFTSPFEASLEIGDPELTTNNQQVGIYLQDDWQPIPRLTLNLGVRWDYEHNWLNNDYVTPQWVRSAVQTFTSEFPFFNANDYITDGDDRPRFFGAIQPRGGFSLDLRGDNSTVVFGGGGLFYDRVNYNTLLDENYKVQRPRYTFRFAPSDPAPGEILWNPRFFSREELVRSIASGEAGRPEVFLINNNQRPPYSVHASAGVRQALGGFTLSATGTMVNGYNYFKWIWGHRDPQTNELQWGRAGELGMANIIISTDEGRTWYRALMLSAGRPLTGDAWLGGDLSYTLAKTETNAYNDVEDPFALDYIPGDPTLGFNRIPSRFDERHRVVLNLAARLPYGVRMSTVTTLGSGFPYTLSTGCQGPWDFDDPEGFCRQQGFDRPNEFIPGFLANPPGLGPRSERPEARWFGPFGKWAYRNVDLRLQKDFAFRQHTLGLSADVINVFNFDNFNFDNFEYNLRWDTNQGEGPFNPRFPRGEFSTFESRRVQFGLKYSF